MLTLRFLILIYKGHLKVRLLPELLALFGIAASVALLFAVQVANTSIVGSFDQFSEGIAGRGSIEVFARSPEGFNQSAFHKVEKLPDVDAAAPVLESRIAVKTGRASKTLTLIGFDSHLVDLGGKLVRDFENEQSLSDLGLHLPAPVASSLRVVKGDYITVQSGARGQRIPVAGILDPDKIGSLVQSPVAVAHLGFVQDLAAMPAKLTRILVSPKPGRFAEAKSQIKKTVGQSLGVRNTSTESKILELAAAPDRQSSSLFSAVSLVVGILLAYNAMLLAVMERRRVVTNLHFLGAPDSLIVFSLIFDALILGIIGSAVGVLAGDLLSMLMIHQIPSFLSAAFAIGSQRIVSAQTVIVSLAAGVFASLAAAIRPALSVLKVGPLEAFTDEQGETKSKPFILQRKLFLAGLAITLLSVVAAVVVPSVTIFSAGGVVIGMLMMLPEIVAHLLNVVFKITRRTNSAAMRVSMGELVASPSRATALAGVGALAVFAIMAITGPTRDIERGMRQLSSNFFNNADSWITVRGKENATGTFEFDQKGVVKRLEHLPEVGSARVYRSSFLDLGTNRVWVIGESAQAKRPLAPTQLVHGDIDEATRHIRAGGWLAMTQTLAAKLKLKVGQRFSLPTPTGMRRFRLAATLTNYGWPPGVIVTSSEEYRQGWNSELASAIEVDFKPGVTAAQGKSMIEDLLGKGSPLVVKTTAEREAEVAAATQQGLERLNQIANMVLIAAILAVISVMLGSAWQRRARLWSLMSLGMSSGALYRTLFFETGVILLIGCLIGVFFGTIGQAVGGRWMHLSASYPVPFEPAWGLAVKTLVLATVCAMIAVIIPVRVLFNNKRVELF